MSKISIAIGLVIAAIIGLASIPKAEKIEVTKQKLKVGYICSSGHFHASNANTFIADGFNVEKVDEDTTKFHMIEDGEKTTLSFSRDGGHPYEITTITIKEKVKN
jgi:hypothetical protein